MENDLVDRPTDIVIREIQAHDLTRVAAVHLLAFPDSALSMLGTEAIRRYYELSMGARVLKTRSKPQPSLPLLTSPKLHHFGILAIAVHPQRQGLGIGKLLMDQAEAEARRYGYQEMDLTVSPRNRQAIQFYERLNWKKFSKDSVWKGEMRKFLAS